MQKIPRENINNFFILKNFIQKKYNIKIITDNIPCIDNKLQKIYQDIDILNHPIKNCINLFAHKHGFNVVENPETRKTRIFLLQRHGIGSTNIFAHYIPNVSENELITSFENLKLLSSKIFNSSKNNKKELILDLTKNINTRNNYHKISELSEIQKYSILNITKSVFLKGLQEINSPFIDNRNQIFFTKNKDRIEVHLFNIKDYLINKSSLLIEDDWGILINQIPSLNTGVKSLDFSNTKIFSGKRIYVDEIKSVRPNEIAYLLRDLFRLESKYITDGIWSFSPKRIPIDASYNHYKSSLLGIIPNQINNLMDISFFKKKCSYDLPFLKSKNELKSYLMSKNIRYIGITRNLCEENLYKEINDMLKVKNKIDYNSISDDAKRNFLLFYLLPVFNSVLSEESLNSNEIFDALNNLYFKIYEEIIQGTKMTTLEIAQKNLTGDFIPVFSSSIRK